MKAPIKWMGGKSRSVKKILPLIPEHKTYVEPFFGAGWIYFAKEPSWCEVINDINGDLINFFEVIRSNIKEFETRQKFTLRSREIFNEYRETLDDESLSSLERAFRFYYINQNSFGGLVRYNSSGKCNSPFAGSPDKYAQSSYWDFDKIRNAHGRLQNTIIENDTYQNVIKRYDRDYTLFFLDPPYQTGGTYNKEQDFDYVELKNILEGIKGKFILTLNGSLASEFSDFRVYENDVAYTINCNKEKQKSSRKEIIITNFETEKEMK